MSRVVRPVLVVIFQVILTATVWAAPANPIVFVTQVPQPEDFATIASTFANHMATMQAAPRGGDLYIRYTDGTLKNLTAAAGYGSSGMQGANAIAVRDPSVSWDGSKVIFSMVVGAPNRYDYNPYRWQIYEISNLGKNQTPLITKVARQPAGYNNVMPIYSLDDQILFISDRPRNGEVHLYPQLDEYESTPTNTGLWKLNPQSGALQLLDHAPSGDFHPIIDSYGRVLMTRWDHLQQDQQAENGDYGAFTYSSESASATKINSRREEFPEARSAARREHNYENLHTINHFFPWEINQDGTAHETLNHVGRHELHEYFDRSFNNDSNLREFISAASGRKNSTSALNYFHLQEDPLNRGRYLAVNAPEFHTHSGGQLVALTAPMGMSADDIELRHLTHPATAQYTNSPPAGHSGFYRDPLVLLSGDFMAVHTAETRADSNQGSRQNPSSRFDFRIKFLRQSGGYWVADSPLTAGISKSVSYYDPDVLVSYSGPLWELQPVELTPRSKPTARVSE
ncbi:MAG: hypothetical protein KDA87_26615, partial [Planctomycetales bacterium]|nr:hypothetical protein [Planctomycetales bacterium]